MGAGNKTLEQLGEVPRSGDLEGWAMLGDLLSDSLLQTNGLSSGVAQDDVPNIDYWLTLIICYVQALL